MTINDADSTVSNIAKAPGKKPTIFLIEDDKHHAKNFIEAAQARGYEVLWHAKDGNEALDIIRIFTPGNKPDYIVTDNQFFLLSSEELDTYAAGSPYCKLAEEKVENGIILSLFMQKHPVIGDVPIFMNTSIASSSVRQQANRVGIKEVVNGKELFVDDAAEPVFGAIDRYMARQRESAVIK